MNSSQNHNCPSFTCPKLLRHLPQLSRDQTLHSGMAQNYCTDTTPNYYCFNIMGTHTNIIHFLLLKSSMGHTNIISY